MEIHLKLVIILCIFFLIKECNDIFFKLRGHFPKWKHFNLDSDILFKL